MEQKPLDLSRVFTLEPHGPDTYVGETPQFAWGGLYGGHVVAQALWAATQTVREEHAVHSLHAYFILRGDLTEPVRYEVDRVRNGRSFTTRRVIARQSGGAILTLACSFQVEEEGPETQSAVFPEDVTRPESLKSMWDAGAERCDLPPQPEPPRVASWMRFPLPLGDDFRLHACALAYLSDLGPMEAVTLSHPEAKGGYDESMLGVSLDHALWFHRQARADEWVLVDFTGHGMIGSRGLATGPMFDAHGTHVATVAQEGLLRRKRK